MGRNLLFRLVATCVHLGFCFLVTVMLSVGVASVLGYTNGHKNPEEISETVQFTLNIKPKILLQWAPHASHKIKLAVRGGCPKASGCEDEAIRNKMVG
ncbi:PREDICTED: nuclear pore complex protein GP210-like isoform X4 [Brassica oleracea var. oleracea]|uniref:nuclear pore complex protein GP210-like isoform X4 n=1 Tax=Brassica oleracea var. oleracea TaxID=109376 RepID=UPI0006A6C681|nr:PREDICTED: nuclear pore complex protein GP210-like isoform X4 [Brassica oleracea var. oleracea]